METKNIDIFVYTKREGLMSPVGHDLKLTARKFTVDRDGSRVSVTVDARSLEVDACIVDGREKSVKAKDRKTIEKNIVKDVLVANKHPKVLFEGEFTDVTDDSATLKGDLTIVGTTRSVKIPFEKTSDHWIGSVTIDQTRWGIKPYTALLGTLKLKPELQIEVNAPADLELDD